MKRWLHFSMPVKWLIGIIGSIGTFICLILLTKYFIKFVLGIPDSFMD